MITQKIPYNSIFVSTSSGFSASYALGEYNFDFALNKNHIILPMDPGTIYFIDCMQIGSNLPEDIYNQAIKIRPEITLKKSITGQIVYPRPLYLTNFAFNRPVTAYCETNKKGENLLIDCLGNFEQTPEMIGISDIKIEINFQIYAITSKEYQTDYRNQSNSSFTKK